MMKKLILIALSLAVLAGGTYAKKEPVDYVNPFVESMKSRYFFFNSACRPFGMVNLSPDTVLRGCWQSGYRYQEPFIRGLSHIHYWGIGGLSIMPTAGEIDFTKGVEEWKSPFSHEREKAGAGYHQVYLDKYGINVELTSTDRVGYHRYSFDGGGDANLVLNLSGEQSDSFMEDSFIKRVSTRELQGWVRMRHFNIPGMRTKLFFAIRSDRPIIDIRHWQLEKPEIKPLESGEVSGDNMCAILGFGRLKNKKLNLQVAVSWTSMEMQS